MATSYTIPSEASWHDSPIIGWRRGLSLRWRLVLLVLVSVVPLLGFILAYQYSGYRENVANTGQQTLALARSMALLVDAELQESIGTLQVLAISRALRAGDLETFRTLAETIVAQQFPGANIVLLKEDGQQVMNTLLPRGTPLPIRTNLESIQQVFATGRPAVSNLYQGAAMPRPVVAIDVPVKGPDEAVIYVLSLNPRLEAFGDIIRRQHPPANWVIAVIDRHGSIVARVSGGDQFVGHKVAAGSLDKVLTEREGITESVSLEGTHLLSAFSHADRFGWAVGIGIPKNRIDRTDYSRGNTHFGDLGHSSGDRSRAGILCGARHRRPHPGTASPHSSNRQ